MPAGYNIEGHQVIQSFNQEKRLQAMVNQPRTLSLCQPFCGMDALFFCAPALSCTNSGICSFNGLFFGYRGHIIWEQQWGPCMPLSSTYIPPFWPLDWSNAKLFMPYQASMAFLSRVFALIDERNYEPLQRKWPSWGQEEQYSFWTASVFLMMANTRFWIFLSVNRGAYYCTLGHTGSEIVYYQCPHAFYRFQSGLVLLDDVDIELVRKSWEKIVWIFRILPLSWNH